MIPSKEDRGGVAPKIKRLVPSAEIQIDLRRNFQSGSKGRKVDERRKNHKMGERERKDQCCLRVWMKKKKRAQET